MLEKQAKSKSNKISKRLEQPKLESSKTEDAIIDEFIEANPNLAEFSYGRQGNIVLLFITFHNDITYCYQVDAQGKTYDVTM